VRISIIIPTINESEHIEPTLTCLQPFRQQGHEVIVVDGGSQDATVELAKRRADKVIQTTPGRAQQMNVGASHATGDILWFIHADSQVSGNAAHQILKVPGMLHNRYSKCLVINTIIGAGLIFNFPANIYFYVWLKD